MTSLKVQAVRGVTWSAISQFARQGTLVLTTVILARLLSPSDFGLVGMAMVVIGFINIFKDLGTSAAVIQKRELSEEFLSSIFWLNLGFGLFAMLILYLLAPMSGLYYQEPRVVVVLRVLSISFLISSLGIVHKALLERSLSFNSLARLEILSVVIGAMVGIVLALTNGGVWSLVSQALTTIFVSTVLLWFTSTWRPQMNISLYEANSVSRFSLNLTGYNIFNYFARNADYLLIGRYLGAQDLGFYTLAYQVLLFPLQNITAIVGRVLYPVLSIVKEDNTRFTSAYLKVVVSIAMISFPLMISVFLFAKPLIFIFFGEKWQAVIPLIMIFAPVGLIQSIGATVGSIYQVKGRTDWMFLWGIGAGSMAILAFIIGLQWGIIGVAVGYAIISFVLFYPNFAIPFQLIGLKFLQLLRALWPVFRNSGIMIAAMWLIGITLPDSLPDIYVMVILISLGCAIYLVANWILNRNQLQELLRTVRFSEK